MTSNTPLSPVPPNPADESIDLFDLAVRFLMEWRRLVLYSVVIFLLGVAYIYSMKPLYEANATLLPQGNGDASALSSFFNTRSPGDIFIGLLGSRSVEDEVIDRANLIQVYKAKTRDVARRMLAGSSTFSTARGTLVNIQIRNDNAELAQRIANAYLDALEDQHEQMLATEAAVHDRFYEQRLGKEADAVSAAEEQLKKTQVSSGIVQPEAQTSIGLNAIANVRAQITSLQVQLAATRLGATDQNPQVKAIESQIGQLQAEEHAMESASSGSGTGAAASARQMPELNLEYSRKQRDLRFHEALLTSISNQYENSRLAEGYSGAAFVVVDRAVAPDMKAWPPRRALLIADFVLSIMAGVILIALTLAWRKLMSSPIQRERLQILRGSFFQAR